MLPFAEILHLSQNLVQKLQNSFGAGATATDLRSALQHSTDAAQGRT